MNFYLSFYSTMEIPAASNGLGYTKNQRIASVGKGKGEGEIEVRIEFG